MKIYLVPYWLPFPWSEYGGLECVIAKDIEHCVQLLAEDVGEYFREQYPDYVERIRSEVWDAKSYELVGSNLEPGVIESFTT